MERAELLNFRISIVSTVIAGFSVISGVVIYIHGLNESIEKEQALINMRSKVEYQRKLWDERRESYKALAVTLGSIAAEIDIDKKISSESLKSFSEAYWGLLILVENESVKSELVKLKDDLRDLEKSRISANKIKLRIERIISLSKTHIDEAVDAQKF
ncbi:MULTISPECIES: hypothetical protein [Pseudoalteromonas]|uniref:hypothetical protein n=1 Tax=Pseudoalteromonas TaxID=53246 RepID=UPI001891960F|nr:MULTISPECIES: hypothetical protein [Pseudoalteromonas]MCG7562472.1 hypothetical protein [Pseudoalteromonas sp. McH1-42]MEC4087162.1 hypothetical protein [Pseudoalteromonas rubra]